MSTLLTYEEWWKYEGERRKKRPYTYETELRYKWVKEIDGHKREVPANVIGAYEKAYLHKEPYEYSFDNPQAK